MRAAAHMFITNFAVAAMPVATFAVAARISPRTPRPPYGRGGLGSRRMTALRQRKQHTLPRAVRRGKQRGARARGRC